MKVEYNTSTQELTQNVTDVAQEEIQECKLLQILRMYKPILG